MPKNKNHFKSFNSKERIDSFVAKQITPTVSAAKRKSVLPYEILSFSFLIILAIIYTIAIQKPLNNEIILPSEVVGLW